MVVECVHINCSSLNETKLKWNWSLDTRRILFLRRWVVKRWVLHCHSLFCTKKSAIYLTHGSCKETKRTSKFSVLFGNRWSYVTTSSPHYVKVSGQTDRWPNTIMWHDTETSIVFCKANRNSKGRKEMIVVIDLLVHWYHKGLQIYRIWQTWSFPNINNILICTSKLTKIRKMYIYLPLIQ